MGLATDTLDFGLGAAIGRRFTSPGAAPDEEVEWGRRDVRIVGAGDGEPVFEQLDVEFPVSWSANASNIVAQKYFRGQHGAPDRERSLRQVVDRIVDTITDWGRLDGYFADDEAAAFNAELKFVMLTQRAAFNSPVWFNIGVPGARPQASACFILSVDDTMGSILDWYRDEALIFKGGSGAGANLSRIRSSVEPLERGGTASGPLSFMRGADASAGAIKSGGTTRRAAKMVILDVDHPDVEEFIEAKSLEERKIRALRDAGFDMGLGGADVSSVQFQNANNSVRISDEFMHAVEADADWPLPAVTTGEPIRVVRARELWRKLCAAAWECADPGVQFDTTINRWHTAPRAGRISASNPCSEYFHLDDSACNLASLNLRRFADEDGSFDVEAFTHTVRIVFTAQEILVGRAEYPTPKIEATTKAFRQIGLGYANLGGLLMALGLPYDSDGGRAWAAAVTSLMTGTAYWTSASLAARLGAFDGFAENTDAMLGVLRRHREAAVSIDDAHAAPSELIEAGRRAWDAAVALAEESGVRNSQATVLAPTGTIGLTMDCDTTGIEPDFGLVKTKQLFGGGVLATVNQTIAGALRRLGYGHGQIANIEAHVAEHHSMVGAPHVAVEHLPVFACSMGDNTISSDGHLRMMAAVQPLLSGGISKTVNLPETATVDEVEHVYRLAWELGLKSVAIYRDNCKTGQPLSTAGPSSAPASAPPPEPVRRRLSRSRPSRTFEFRVADCKGYATIGEYDDGQPGEIFLTVSKQGSTIAGVMDAFAKSISYGLQHGVPVRAFVEAFTNMRFEPAGMTDDPDVRFVGSIMDYLFRRLAIDYLTYEERAELGIFTVEERLQPTLPGIDDAGSGPAAEVATADAPMCMVCGVSMVRAGSCHVCTTCGSTSGCS
ncbi:MAG: vitamin B12-dependent ribonucleotide reductase [Ilumatobacteraceae bacterium]